VRTPWRGRLFFGRTYEDAELDAALLPAGRVFCIAGAGETPFRLARDGREVVAVDVNPEQIAYVRARIAGAPPRDGVAERLLAAGRRLIGWRRGDVEEFLALEDPAAQASTWTALESRRFQAVLALTLRPRVLRPVHGDLAAAVPPAAEVRSRLRRGFARHANASNPYARLWLLGEQDPEPPRRVETTTAAAAAYLEAAPRRSFDGFALSNVLDGAGAAAEARLLAAVGRTARPGAVALLRSFGVPATAEEDALAVRDRAHVWGRIRCFTF
jgi:S-adenosylmethionine:diacylglycerol 3-amino-3-carboxypropyl transferase